MDFKTAREILKIDTSATLSEIKQSFKKLSLQYHPDRCGGDSTVQTQINEAFNYIFYIKGDEIESKPQTQLAPNVHDLNLTLEEIAFGCTKKQIITRKVVEQNGVERTEKATLDVQVRPGFSEGARIKIPDEGDICWGKTQANVVFIVRELAHPIFRKVKRFDIEYRAKITPDKASKGSSIHVPTLDQKTITLKDIPRPITPKTVHKISNQGLPNPENHKRGDLIVLFDILQDPPIKYDLFITLEQILFGYTKRVQINRSVTEPNGRQRDEEKILNVGIKRGTHAGTELVFEQLGDKNPNALPADIIFVVKDKPHAVFKRKNIVDLEYVAKITPEIAILGLGTVLDIPTLENDSMISLAIDGVINTERDCRVIKGRGLPFVNNNEARGDLIVRFEIMQEQNPPIVRNLYLSPDEIIHSCEQQIDVTCLTIDSLGNEMFATKKFILNINHNIENGEKVVFHQKGNERLGILASDVVFVIWKFDNSNGKFQIVGSDVEYSVLLSEMEAKNGTKVEIPVFDSKEVILLHLENINQNDSRYRLSNRGLPYLANDNRTVLRGDLIVNVILKEILKQKPKLKDPPVYHVLPLSLQEILNGKTKKMKVHRHRITEDGNRIREDKILMIDIPPGTEAGKQFIFDGESEQHIGTLPGDVIFVIQDKQHEHFVRNGADLNYEVPVSKDEANKPFRFMVPTLRGEEWFTTDGPITPFKCSMVIKGHGLPYPDDGNKWGNILVQFVLSNQNEKSSTNNSNTRQQEIPRQHFFRKSTLLRKLFNMWK